VYIESFLPPLRLERMHASGILKPHLCLKQRLTCMLCTRHLYQLFRAGVSPRRLQAHFFLPVHYHKRLPAVEAELMHGLSVVGHRCQARNDRAWAGGRATVGVLQGKVYYEVTVADEGLCRVGWSTRQAGLDLGTEPISFGFGGTGGNAIASEHAAAS